MFQFNTRKSTIPKVKNGIDTKRPENSKLLRAVSRTHVNHI
jgi:hypothetical protein